MSKEDSKQPYLFPESELPPRKSRSRRKIREPYGEEELYRIRQMHDPDAVRIITPEERARDKREAGGEIEKVRKALEPPRAASPPPRNQERS